jgi:hypothetical protein
VSVSSSPLGASTFFQGKVNLLVMAMLLCNESNHFFLIRVPLDPRLDEEDPERDEMARPALPDLEPVVRIEPVERIVLPELLVTVLPGIVLTDVFLNWSLVMMVLAPCLTRLGE